MLAYWCAASRPGSGWLHGHLSAKKSLENECAFYRIPLPIPPLHEIAIAETTTIWSVYPNLNSYPHPRAHSPMLINLHSYPYLSNLRRPFCRSSARPTIGAGYRVSAYRLPPIATPPVNRPQTTSPGPQEAHIQLKTVT